MLFYKRSKKNKADVSVEAISAISNKWKDLKKKIAAHLQKKFELLSKQTKKYTLIFFCVSFGGSSVAIIVHSITTKTNAVKIAKISAPAHVNDNSQLQLQPDNIITKEEYKRVLQFENYMLNLRNDSAGKKKFDSIIKNRPQLMDSIALFERMYLSQTKK